MAALGETVAVSVILVPVVVEVLDAVSVVVVDVAEVLELPAPQPELSNIAIETSPAANVGKAKWIFMADITWSVLWPARASEQNIRRGFPSAITKKMDASAFILHASGSRIRRSVQR
ncbi:hypothetical protein GCM10011586_10870 [Silvibacterium dinghuense]|nr:hypothetical protein GCM10011586_10870 [Silvibacterium dinghuense]